MKNSRKLMSILLIVAMLFTLVSPAMAAMEGELTGGSITINDAVNGQTYNAYQILYLESYNANANAYAYKANSAWADWLKTQTAYVTIDDQGYVTWVEAKNNADGAAEFAKLAQAQLEGKTADGTATAGGTSVTIPDLKLGYYLVDTTLGTLCALDTTNKEVIMYEKNEEPTVKKEVQEDSKVNTNDAWGETNDADINQVVNYRAVITVKAGAKNYILHDKMTEGLTFDADSVVVKYDNQTVENTNYSVRTETEDGCTFEVVFTDGYIASVAANLKNSHDEGGPTEAEIVVEYSATLNENAVVGLDGNLNTVKLQYSDSAEPTYTPEDTTITYTWDMDVVKYTMNGENEVKLAGATFKLSTDQAGTNVIKFHFLDDNKYEVCAATDCDKKHVTEITTDATGTFYIKGLDAGTYYLTETAAPDGYNKLNAAIEVEIDHSGAVKIEDENGDKVTVTEVKVENKTGAELPSTGGIGTTIFYVLGGALVIGAGVLLVTKRRMGAE